MQTDLIYPAIAALTLFIVSTGIGVGMVKKLIQVAEPGAHQPDRDHRPATDRTQEAG